jgi:predicted GIY-YIG superfamily endonuclease
MDSNITDTASSSACWVYILQSASKEYQIGYTTSFPGQAGQTDAHGEKLVYLRAFEDSNDAFGHKLFLEQISARSLLRIIRMRNPSMFDLRGAQIDANAFKYVYNHSKFSKK